MSFLSKITSSDLRHFYSKDVEVLWYDYDQIDDILTIELAKTIEQDDEYKDDESELAIQTFTEQYKDFEEILVNPKATKNYPNIFAFLTSHPTMGNEYAIEYITHLESSMREHISFLKGLTLGREMNNCVEKNDSFVESFTTAMFQDFIDTQKLEVESLTCRDTPQFFGTIVKRKKNNDGSITVINARRETLTLDDFHIHDHPNQDAEWQEYCAHLCGFDYVLDLERKLQSEICLTAIKLQRPEMCPKSVKQDTLERYFDSSTPATHNNIPSVDTKTTRSLI